MKPTIAICAWLSTCLLMTGCMKATGKEVYAQLSKNEAGHVSSFTQAIHQSPIQDILFNTKIEIDLSQNDMVFNNNDILSYYEIFKFSGNENQKIGISIRSLCDCAGFKKQIVYPIIYVLDKNGDILDPEVIAYERRDPVFAKYPYHLYGSNFLNLPYSGEYYLFIAAHNRDIEQVAGTVRMATVITSPGPGYNTMIPVFGALNVRTHPTGKIEFEVNTK